MERVWLANVTSVIGLHRQRERERVTEDGASIGTEEQNHGWETSKEQWTIVLVAER